MNKYILVIMLLIIAGCVNNKSDIKDNVYIEQEKNVDKNIIKDLLFYFWVITEGL